MKFPLGTILILRKEIRVGGGSKKAQTPYTYYKDGPLLKQVIIALSLLNQKSQIPCGLELN